MTYLDWNATAPPLDDVIAAMAEAARVAWGNPASIHGAGRAARARVEEARGAVAALVGVDARDVVLTSGGTEANNLALRAPFSDAPSGGAAAPGVLVTSRLEHPSVTRVAEALEREGAARVRWLRVDEGGAIDLEDLAGALDEGGVRLVAVQAVNHETGVVQPVHQVMSLAARHGARVHVDAVQAWGRIDTELRGADTLSLAGHKLRGPKGIGALVTRPGLKIEPILRGGSQERGVRPGTVDPVAAAGLAVAARHAKGGPARYREVAGLRDVLEAAIRQVVPEALVNGRGPRAPHVTNVYFPGWDGAELVAALDLEGVYVSSGSACSAGTSEPSPVLTAMAGGARAAGSVRFSLGESTTTGDVEDAVAALARVIGRIR